MMVLVAIVVPIYRLVDRDFHGSPCIYEFSNGSAKIGTRPSTVGGIQQFEIGQIPAGIDEHSNAMERINQLEVYGALERFGWH